MKAIKGFDAQLKCRNFQFEVGQTYKHEGAVKACRSGFHAVPADLHPLTVFEFYPPAGSRFCIVEVDGATDREENKIAAEILTVQKEMSCAMATGPGGKVRGDVDGVDLFAREIVWTGDKYERRSIACGTTGLDGIRAGVWYRCEGGKLVEMAR